MQTKTVQSLQKMKIAVVDDSRFSLKIIKDFFDKSLVPNVDYYNDSQEFAESDLKYDLFIIDLVMPIYDGEDLIYKIREDNKESIIILVTQYGDAKAIGHCMSIGGDDFVGIIPDLHCDKVCQQILATFDAKSLKFFTQEDREKGYIEVANRKGIIEQFPLTSLSIGVVVADVGRFHNILEIGEVGAQVKHAAKSVMGSSYAIDRRKEG